MSTREFEIGGETRLAVVIGDPVEHSMSPTLHNAAFAAIELDAVFVALRVAAGDLGAAITTLRGTNAVGASVTVPHKTAVIEHCTELSQTARAIGAVNCVEFDGDRVIGHNTDAGGFARALTERFGEHPDGWRPLILGGGGAARAVAIGLEQAGAAPAQVIARTPSKVRWTRAKAWTAETLATELPNRNLIVDCTSAGLSATSEREIPAPIDLGLCGPETVASTLVYHRETLLLAEARALGLGAIDGMGMLVHQAMGALEIWLEEQAEAINVDALWDAVTEATGRRRRGSSIPPLR